MGGLRFHNLPSSIFGAEDRKTTHLQSSIFGPEDRRIFPIYDLRPRRMDRRLERSGGGWLLRRREGGGSSKMGISSIFRGRRRNNFCICDLRGRKNEELPFSTFPTRRSRTLLTLFFFRNPLIFDQWPPAPLSYSEIWVFSVIYLENRSEDRDRTSILKGV